MEEMGIPVKYSHHEAAPSQHEIDLQNMDALTMADNVVSARLLIKELGQLRFMIITKTVALVQCQISHLDTP